MKVQKGILPDSKRTVSKPQTFENKRKNQGFSLRGQGGKQHWFKGDRIGVTGDIA